MKKLIFTLLVCLIGVACRDRESGSRVHDVNNILICGVKDPLQNIKWLREFCENLNESQDFSEVSIKLYKVTDKDEYIFRIAAPSLVEYAPNQYYSTLCYRNCSGDTVFRWETVTPPGGKYNDFMKDKEYVAELFHFVKP